MSGIALSPGSPIALADFGQRYRVVVKAGTHTITSTETVLVDAGSAPVFTTDLQPSTPVVSGDDVTLEVATVATTPVTYQWQRPANGTWSDLVGRTGKVLELKAVRDQGTAYRVVATAGSRSTTSTETTLVVSQRSTTVRVSNVVAKRGKKVAVTLRASEAGKATIVVRQGKKRWTRTVDVSAGRTVVKLDKAVKKPRKVNVKVTLTPTSVDHAPATATRTVRVR